MLGLLVAALALLYFVRMVLMAAPVQVKLDHAKEVRVIGDEENIALQAPTAALILDGEVYVVDSGARKIKVFSETGVPRFEFQGGRFHDVRGSKLVYPSAIALSPRRTLFVADQDQGILVEFDAKGKALDVLRLPKSGEKKAKPLALTFDILGHLYVTDGAAGKVYVYVNKKLLREFGEGTLNHPGGIAVDIKRRVYVSDSNNQRILVYNPLGRPEREWRVTDRDAFVPRGLALDKRNRLVVADTLNSRIVFLDANGKRVKRMMILPNLLTLFLPSSVFVDDMNNLVIADRGLGQVFILKI